MVSTSKLNFSTIKHALDANVMRTAWGMGNDLEVKTIHLWGLESVILSGDKFLAEIVTYSSVHIPGI